MTVAGTKMLSDLTLEAVRAESARAHVKHHRPDQGSGSLFDDGLTLVSRLAALLEEVGEVVEELMPAGRHDPVLDHLMHRTRGLGDLARRLTYDGGGEPGLSANGIRQLPDGVDRTKLVKELNQVANVALSWAQYVDDGER